MRECPQGVAVPRIDAPNTGRASSNTVTSTLAAVSRRQTPALHSGSMVPEAAIVLTPRTSSLASTHAGAYG